MAGLKGTLGALTLPVGLTTKVILDIQQYSNWRVYCRTEQQKVTAVFMVVHLGNCVNTYVYLYVK